MKTKSPSLGEAGKRAAAEKLLVHRRKANNFFTLLKESINECKDRDNLAVLTFDYVQNVHLPEISATQLTAYSTV